MSDMPKKAKTTKKTAKTSKVRVNYGPQTFTKVLSVLDCFSMMRSELSLRELASLTKISASTLYRYLVALEDEGYLVKSEQTGKYHGGAKLIELSGIALSRMDFVRHGQLELDKVAAQLRMNASMGVLLGSELLHVAFAMQENSSNAFHNIIGRKSPATCTAMGKVLLAAMDKGEVSTMFAQSGFTSMTSNSITTLERLLAELKDIREKGYAVDDRENSETSRCLAFPILDKHGNVVAAMSVSGFAERFEQEKNSIRLALMGHAERLSSTLGYIGKYPTVIAE